jgi:recombination protein RecT
MSKHDYTAAGKALTQQHSNSPGEVLKQRRAFLEARLPQLSKWIKGGIRPEALVRWALLDLQQNEKLRACTPESLYLGLLACATVGLEPGSLHQLAFLVPFAGKAQFLLGWRGMVKLARRSGEVTGISANVVHERDVFELDLGTANSLIHRPARGDRGQVTGAYAIARMRDGGHELEFLDDADLGRIQKIAEARGKSPAWQQWPDQQQRKSAIRRLSKRLPQGHDYIIAQAIEQAVEEHGDARAVLDIETEGAASASESQASAAPVVPGAPDEAEAAEIARMEREGA